MSQSIRRLETLGDEWDALAAPFESPLLEHDWFLSCARAFHAGDDLQILTVMEGGTLAAAAPLVRERAPAGRRLTLLGASVLYEPSGWLFRSDSALDALADEALTLGDPLILQRIPADSPVYAALVARHRGVVLLRGTTTSLGVITQSSWQQYRASLGGQITTNLPRLRRKAERALGPMRISQCSPAPADVNGLLETVIRVEGSGWKGRRGSALSTRADLRTFFGQYALRSAARGRLRVTTLSFGSDVGAVELSVEAFRRIWQLKIGYNEALAKYYPGLHLTEFSIRTAFERGLRSYEFLGSAAAWQEQWAPQVRRYRMLVAYPLSTRGLLIGCCDLAGLMWRRGIVFRRKSQRTA